MPQMRERPNLPLLVLVVALSGLLGGPLAARQSSPGDRSVTVNQQPPTVRTVTFPPGQPPEEVQMNAGEDALCRSNFGVDVRYEFRYNAKPAPGGRVAIRLSQVTFTYTLSLDQTIFLPTDADEKLKAHEDGHRRIAEAVYAQGDRIAREVVAEVLTERWEGVGDTEEQAVKQAADPMFQQALEEYVKRTADVSSRLNEQYDQLTDHARNGMDADAAVRKVLSEAGIPLPEPRD